MNSERSSYTPLLIHTDTEENRVRPAASVLQRLRAHATDDDGISLIEVVVSLVILAVVMTAAAGFFINGLRATGGQSSRQAAISLTNQQLEKVNALPSYPSGTLLTGRYSGAVTRLLATDTGKVLTGQDDTSNSTAASYDYDATATAASKPLVPTGVPIVAGDTSDPNYNSVPEGKVTYQIRTFIDPCWLPTGTATSTNTTRNLACVASSTVPSGAPGVTMAFRVTVVTSWKGGPSTNCAGGCSFNDSTLIDPHADATFNTNISQPTLTATTPSSVGAGASVTLTLSGTNFVYGAAITVSCNTCSATVGTVDQSTNTGSSIAVPMTFGSGTGTATIRLTNPDGGTATISLTVGSPPTVTSTSRSTVPNGSAASVTFTGTNLSATTSLTVNGGTIAGASYASGAITFTYTGTASTASPVFTLTNTDGSSSTYSGVTVSQSKPVITAGGPTTVTLSKTSTVILTMIATGTGFVASPLPTVYYSLNGYQAYASQPATVSPTQFTFPVSFGPATPTGTYTAVFGIVDADGGQSTYTTTLVIKAAP